MNTIKTISLTAFLFACVTLAGSCVFGPGASPEKAARLEKSAMDNLISGSPDFPDHEILESFFIGEFTAYNPTIQQTDDTPLIMASGKRVYDGAAACPGDYEFGTMIEIEGLGAFTCEDRMARRFRDSNYFDILMFDRTAALKFGRRTMRFRVLEESPADGSSS